MQVAAAETKKAAEKTLAIQKNAQQEKMKLANAEVARNMVSSEVCLGDSSINLI